MTGAGFHTYNANNYNIDKLREKSDNSSDDIDPSANKYSCQTCEWETFIKDHQRFTPNYCELCETVRTFERV